MLIIVCAQSLTQATFCGSFIREERMSRIRALPIAPVKVGLCGRKCDALQEIRLTNTYMRRIFVLMLLVLTASYAMAAGIFVNCDAQQSLNRTLSVLPKQVPITVWVKGTCTEYVTVKGFNGLTLKGYPGAKLVQPSGDPNSGLAAYVLSIESSQSVTIDGFGVHGGTTVVPIGIGRGSSDVRLRNLTSDGGSWAGIVVYEASQVSLAAVSARNSGYAEVAVVDLSDVHIEDSSFEPGSMSGWHAGLIVNGSSHVTMHNVTIHNMQVGIDIGSKGIVDIWDYNSYYPLGGPLDVVIDNSGGGNFYGVSISDGGSLNLKSTADAKLRILNPGQTWGGDTGGLRVQNGSTLNAGSNLEISSSFGHGVYVTGNSHASFAGSKITGSAHGGVLALNLSTIGVFTGGAPTEIGGNMVDVFCDSKSVVTGHTGMLNAPSVQCTNLLDYDSEPTP